jgi:tryptophanyl-tRNA synthetase
VAKNIEAGDKDQDAGITMGLFNYPVLMSADILAFKADLVPVGKDQIQHIEIARDIAQRFNHLYGEVFTLPEAVVDENTQTLPGLDGRKMSKSYQNTIPLFTPEKDLRKLIMKIKTNSQLPEEPKETEGCTIFQTYRAFASPAQAQALAARYASGIGWGEAKQQLFELLNTEMAPMRERFDYYMTHPQEVEAILNQGAQKARDIVIPVLAKAKQLAGI